MDLLKDIRFIFQVPLEWFKKVDARVFGDHPGSGIKFEQANDGSRAFMIDFSVLDARYGGGGEGGPVTSVDGIGPNISGNVVLNALKEGDLGVTVARQSDLDTAQQTADDAQTAAESAGTSAEGAATAAANAQTTANNAATSAGNAVATANSASQTANAAAQAAASAQETAEGIAGTADQALATANAAAGVASAAQQAVAGKADAQHSHGNLTSDGKLNVAYPSGGCLAAIADSGMLTAASFTSQSAPYVTAENVKKILSTCNLEAAGTVTLKGAQVKLATASKSVVTDANGKLTTKSYTASKWVKTDSGGNLTTTDDTPIYADSTKTGFVLNTAGTISYVAGKYGTVTKKVLTGVTWNGTTLSYSSENWTFKNGILTNIVSNSATTIDTPVVYTGT